MKNKFETNINMDNKDHIVLRCDTLGTTVPETRQNLQMFSPTLTKDSVECVNEKMSHYNNCENSSVHVQSSEYVNYYDNESYVLEQLKTEFPEDVLPQSDCSVNTQIHYENKDLLKFIAKAELNNENVEDRVSLNIEEENDYNGYQFIVKREGLEEQEDVQCKFSDKTLKNGCNLLQRSNKHVKVEINTPLNNGITELHQCQYCGNAFDDYNNLLIHISTDHKQEKSKCNICGRQFKSVGNLNRHILAFHKLDKPIEAVTENCANVQHKCPLNDHLKLTCSGKEDGEDESENIVTRNFTNFGTMLERCCEQQFRSPIHLREHQMLIHRPKISKTNNERLRCDSCKKYFKTKSILTTHIKSMHVDYGRKFKCWCGKEFRTPIHLRKHERLIHERKIQSITNDKFQCDYCKVLFKSKRYLSVHIKRDHYDYGKLFDCWCGKQFCLPIDLRRHETETHRYNVQNTNYCNFHCDHCKKIFTTKANLTTHIMTVHLDYARKFECWCGKQFRTPIHLRKHEILVHRNNVHNTNNCKFQCDYCKVFFKTKLYLLAHIKRIHYDYGKRFDCWCGKQFRSPIYLRQHEILVHRQNVQNNKNCKLQCDYCKVFFKTKQYIRAHIKRIHYDYGKRFDCWCGKQFRSPIHLRDHKNFMKRDPYHANPNNHNGDQFQALEAGRGRKTRSGEGV